MSVSDLITAAFAEAWRTHGAAHEAWIRVSYRLGGLMPDSLLPMSIQQADSLDVHPHHSISNSQQVMFSGLWGGSTDEFVRLLCERKLIDNTGEVARHRPRSETSARRDRKPQSPPR
jgi:hypothetical protein